jgi:hypothetical protein
VETERRQLLAWGQKRLPKPLQSICTSAGEGAGRFVLVDLIGPARKGAAMPYAGSTEGSYASSSTFRCGMAAQIAGQATIATNARDTRISCIAVSFEEPIIDRFEVTSYCSQISNRFRITNLLAWQKKSIEKFSNFATKPPLKVVTTVPLKL